MQAAAICTTFANMMMLQMRSKHRFKISDFMLDFSNDKKLVKQVEASPAWHRLKTIAKQHAGLFNRGGKRKTERFNVPRPDRQRRK